MKLAAMRTIYLYYKNENSDCVGRVPADEDKGEVDETPD